MALKKFNNYIFESELPSQPVVNPTPPVQNTGITTPTGTTQPQGESVEKELIEILTTILCSTSSGTSTPTTQTTEDPCQRQYQVGEDVLYYPYGGENAWKPYNAKVTKMLGNGLIQVSINSPIKTQTGTTTPTGTTSTVFAAPCKHIRKIDNNPATKQFQPGQQLWLWDSEENKHVPVIFVSKNGNRAVVYNSNDPQKKQYSPDYRMIREKKETFFDNYNDFLKNNY